MYLSLTFICTIILPCIALQDTFLTFYVKLVLDLKRHYKSECLVIINSNELLNAYQTAEMSKILSRNVTMAMHLSVHNLQETVYKFRCSGNRPLYILFANSISRKYLHLLRRVPSYPRWLLFIDNKIPSTINHQFLDDIYVPFNCEFLVAENFGSSIQLNEVYHVAQGLPINKRRFGSWSPAAGLEFVKESLYRRRYNLDGIVFKAVTLRDTYPEAFLESDHKLMLSKMDLYGKIWLSMEERYNFTTAIFEFRRNNFGFLVNGSWNGMMSAIVNQQADVAINSFTYETARMRSADFLAPISTSKIYLLVRMPSTVKFQWASFLSPFSSTLWLSVLGSILIFGISLTTTHRAGCAMGIEERSRADEFLLTNSLFHVFGLYCSQGPGTKPRAFSSRSVLVLAGLIVVVISAAYSGALTSFITVQKLDLPYETIEEYIDDPSYHLEISQNGFWIYINDSRADLYRKLYNRMEHRVSQMATNKLSGFEKICIQNKFGWFGSYLANDKFLKMIKCEIIPVPGYLKVDFESVVLTKHSPYTKLFDRNLLYLRWSGLMSRFVQSSGLNHVKKQENLFSVNFQQVVPIFVLFLTGILLSFFVIFVEIFIFHMTT